MANISLPKYTFVAGLYDALRYYLKDYTHLSENLKVILIYSYMTPACRPASNMVAYNDKNNRISQHIG